HVFGQAVILAFAGLIVVRHIVVSPLLRSLRQHRLLVLGACPEARVVEQALESADAPGIKLVGFYPLKSRTERLVSSSRVLPEGSVLDDTVKELGISEIIVAVRDQRGGVLSLRSLVECRIKGAQNTGMPPFFEHIH